MDKPSLPPWSLPDNKCQLVTTVPGRGFGPSVIGAGFAAWMGFMAPAAAAPPPPRWQGTVTVRHQQIIVRVPTGLRRLAPAGASLIQWRESRGPRCVPASELIGATLLRQNSVDLILRDSRRIRAQLQAR